MEGTYGVQIKAVYGSEDPQFVQMDMKMALDTACVKTLDSIPAKANGFMFKDAEVNLIQYILFYVWFEFSNEHYRYLIGDTVYAKILVESVGPMTAVELDSVQVWQNDVTGHCFGVFFPLILLH